MRSSANASSGQVWAIVLAAGDGTRLHSLTADAAGASVPKQFCCLGALATLPDSNIVVQPANRGTAIGMLLPVLQIARRDSSAKIVGSTEA